MTKITELPVGEHFGGIVVENKSRVTIDSAKISGLRPGDYRIIFISTTNKDRSGYLLFSVPPIPDHLDLMQDSMALEPSKDAILDSVNMGTEKDSMLLYSVIRDIYGTYIEDAKNLTWKSSNEKVLTISPSTTDKSRAMEKS